MSLVGNMDVDNEIICLLNYKELLQLRQTNRHMNQCCNYAAKKKTSDIKCKIDKIFDLNRRYYTLMFVNEKQSMDDICDIANYFNLTEYSGKNLNLYGNETIDEFYIMIKDSGYIICFESFNEDEIGFNIDKNQLKRFLFHLFYDDLLFS